MPKNIILLSDGTGNSNIKNRGTNVFKLYEAIDFNSPKYRQVAFYDDGVGTQEFRPLKILGGAFGWGLSRNVRRLYKDLVQTYEQGDKIYLFGFSRGAFTVRRLAGFICEMGILNKSAYNDEQLDSAIWYLFKEYRAKNPAFLEQFYGPGLEALFEKFCYKLNNKQLKFCEIKPNIEFVGVWDTVAAVGLPFDEATDILDSFVFRFKFRDHKLHNNINKAYHALSIDDERQSFNPLLWQQDKRIEQVWFPGVHSNVGGGYPQQGLSLVALDWMMKKAEAAGLGFISTDVEFVKNREYAFDKLYNSRAGLAAYYRYQPRDIAKICNDEKKQIMIESPKFHVSAFERITLGIFDYAPCNIPTTFDVVDNNGLYNQSQQIAVLVGRALSHKTLLEQEAKHISSRRILYYVFMAYSILTLYWLVREDLANPEIGLFGTIKILLSPDGLLDKIAILFWDHPVFIVVGAIIFASTVYVRKRMEGVFSEFWSKLRSDLRKLLI